MIRNYYGDGNNEGSNSFYSKAKSFDSSIITDINSFLIQDQVESRYRIFSNEYSYNLRETLGISWQSKVAAIFCNAHINECRTIQYSILGKALYYYIKTIPTYTFDVRKINGTTYHIYDRVI